ncbi:hypothetical protein KQH65_06740, partial [archaeon]|nr:hypothetical protein [archaeon]
MNISYKEEAAEITLTVPRKYMEAVELIVKGFPGNQDIEEYIQDCIRSGLEADANDVFDYFTDDYRRDMEQKVKALIYN